MGFQYLPQVHTGGNADGVEDYIYRCAILQERHILYRRNKGNYSFVAMPPGQLVPYGNRTPLGHPDLHPVINPCGQVVIIITREDLNIDNLSPFTLRYPLGGILHFTGFLTEYSPEQLLFG